MSIGFEKATLVGKCVQVKNSRNNKGSYDVVLNLIEINELKE